MIIIAKEFKSKGDLIAEINRKIVTSATLIENVEFKTLFEYFRENSTQGKISIAILK